MTFIYNALKAEIRRGAERDDTRVGDLILSTFYLWVTFAPLTRGSAAIGYASLFALFLAADMPLKSSPPERVQADFEAFLEPRAKNFIRIIRAKWIDSSLAERGDPIPWKEIPKVKDAIITPRDLLMALNLCEERDYRDNTALSYASFVPFVGSGVA
jgi:hypothetical protein